MFPIFLKLYFPGCIRIDQHTARNQAGVKHLVTQVNVGTVDDLFLRYFFKEIHSEKRTLGEGHQVNEVGSQSQRISDWDWFH